MTFWNSMYAPDARDREIFGDLYDPPVQFEHGKWHRVLRIEKDPIDGDGQTVEIDECRMPARFFRLRALADVNSVGDPNPAFVFATGSGDDMDHLVVQMARAIAGGMLQPDDPEDCR